jgi:hypothetical protein
MEKLKGSEALVDFANRIQAIPEDGLAETTGNPEADVIVAIDRLLGEFKPKHPELFADVTLVSSNMDLELVFKPALFQAAYELAADRARYVTIPGPGPDDFVT